MAPLTTGAWGTVLLPEYVYLEVVTVIAARRSAAAAVAVGETLLRAREIEFVPCSEHFPAVVATFRQVVGSGLSFVDAAIVAIARARRARHIATFDTDFAAVDGLAMVPSVD
jgi:predicted nucleic acid-binding protein